MSREPILNVKVMVDRYDKSWAASIEKLPIVAFSQTQNGARARAFKMMFLLLQR